MTTTAGNSGLSKLDSGRSAALRAVARLADLKPDSPALMDPAGATVSYSQLWTQIVALSRRLAEAGIGRAETVAVLLPQGSQAVVAVAGAIEHCVCAPLQPRMSSSEVESTLRKLSASAFVASSENSEAVAIASAMGLTVLVAREALPPQAWDLRRPLAAAQSRVLASDTVLLRITSATTGDSKLVPLSATNLDAAVEARRQALRLDDSDRLLLLASLSHDIGIENALAQLLAGGLVIATGGFDPTDYLRGLEQLRPTWYSCSPTVHQAALAQLRRTAARRPTSLRFVQSAGAPLPEDVKSELQQRLGVPVFNDYGMTEVGPVATDAFVAGARVQGSAGRSCGPEIGVMSPLGDLVPSGAEGEIVVRGPSVFSGYVDNPEANRAAFRGGWFLTGDAGRLDDDGNLFVTGRRKDMINRGGEKISPAEVDAVIASHPAVLEAAAFAVPHSTLGEDVACAIVLRRPGDHPVSASDLRAFAAGRLAAFKVPRRICFVDEVPRGELGKPQRWLLTERLANNQIAAEQPSFAIPTPLAPVDPEEVGYVLREVWERILNRHDLGFDDDFFLAGGDSLAAMTMLAEVDELFGSRTSETPASFVEQPTLAGLLAQLFKEPSPRLGSNTDSKMKVFPVSEERSKAKLFCVPADGWEGRHFRRLGVYLEGHMDLFIVRPTNLLHSRALFTLERAGSEMAALVRQVQPEGPYYVGGYCYGGVVAVEAARQLILAGADVRLIFFDVLMPGFPAPIGGARYWIDRARRKWLLEKLAATPEPNTDSHRPGRAERPSVNRPRSLFRLAKRFAGRLAWHGLVPVRPLLHPVEHTAAIQSILRWTQHEYFPIYRARPVHAPILHFLCTDEVLAGDGTPRFGWRAMARRGITERFVSLVHRSVLDESNLPAIADAIRDWSGAQ